MARDDASDRKAFREEVKENIEAGKSPSFQALMDGAGGAHDWKMGTRMSDGSIQSFGPSGFHSNEGAKPGWLSTDWDAGHTKSSASGENLYSVEDRAKNRSDGATLEKDGAILEKPAVEVEGLSVNRDFAQSMEDKGLLKPGTVESAPSTLGWSKESGLLSSHADQSQNSAVQNLSTEPAKQSSTDLAAQMGGSHPDSESLNVGLSQESVSPLNSDRSEVSPGLSNALPSSPSVVSSSATTSSEIDSGLSGGPSSAGPASHDIANSTAPSIPSTHSSDAGSSPLGATPSPSSCIGGSTSSVGSSPSGSTPSGGSTSSSSVSTSASASSSSSGSSGTSSGA